MASITFPLLKGKTAIVTGGTTGIGRAIVLEYVRQGCNVVVNHLGLERDDGHKTSLLQEAEKIGLEYQQNGGKYLAGEIREIPGDISKPEDCSLLVEETVKRFGKLDILVANAGVFTPAKFLECVSLICTVPRAQKLTGLNLHFWSTRSMSISTEHSTPVRQQQGRW